MPAEVAATGERPGMLDRALRVFSDVRAGEGATVLLMFLNLLVLFVSYYIIRTVRDAIILSTGVVPSPVVANLPIEKTPRGAVIVEPTMRSKSRPEVWAMGDCASIPSPSGKPYPNLAQHALREAKVLAQNIAATLRNQPIKPFIYETVGNLAALGHYNGVGKIYGIRLRGFVAWWVWRSYYLFRMPQWRRRIRIMADWTVSLLFGTDIVQLDLIPEERLPLEVMRLRAMHPPAPSAPQIPTPTPTPTPARVTTS